MARCPWRARQQDGLQRGWRGVVEEVVLEGGDEGGHVDGGMEHRGRQDRRNHPRHRWIRVDRKVLVAALASGEDQLHLVVDAVVWVPVAVASHPAQQHPQLAGEDERADWGRTVGCGQEAEAR